MAFTDPPKKSTILRRLTRGVAFTLVMLLGIGVVSGSTLMGAGEERTEVVAVAAAPGTVPPPTTAPIVVDIAWQPADPALEVALMPGPAPRRTEPVGATAAAGNDVAADPGEVEPLAAQRDPEPPPEPAPATAPPPPPTTAPPTTTTQPPPPPSTAPPPVTAPPGGPSEDQWHALRMCESGNRYDAVSSNGLYRGAYQFSRPTWDGVAASFYPQLVGIDPAAAAPGDQDAMAKALYSQSGASPWPHCGKHLY